jgi:hypothetical protein
MRVADLTVGSRVRCEGRRTTRDSRATALERRHRVPSWKWALGALPPARRLPRDWTPDRIEMAVGTGQPLQATRRRRPRRAMTGAGSPETESRAGISIPRVRTRAQPPPHLYRGPCQPLGVQSAKIFSDRAGGRGETPLLWQILSRPRGVHISPFDVAMPSSDVMSIMLIQPSDAERHNKAAARRAPPPLRHCTRDTAATDAVDRRSDPRCFHIMGVGH